MINTEMRSYEYLTYGDVDEYGQPQLGKTKQVVKMAIYPLTQSVAGTISYTDGQYIGFTHSKDITDKAVILYGDQRLKVTYTIQARINQIFLERM